MYYSVLRGPAAEQLHQHTGKLRIGLQLLDQIGNIRRHLRPGSLPDGLLCLPHIRVCIEASLEPLGVDFPVFIKDVRIDLRHHIGLCVTRVALSGLDVTMVQLQLVGRAGVTQGVENNISPPPPE